MAVVTYILSVPANTSETLKEQQYISLHAGRLTSIGIGFMDGCSNMVFVTIHHRLHQILPSIEGQTLSWNDHIFFFPYDVKIPDVGTQLLLSGWSPSTRYSHDIHFWFVIVDEPKAKTETLLERLILRIPG